MCKSVSESHSDFHRQLPALPMSQDSHLKYRAAHWWIRHSLCPQNPGKTGKALGSTHQESRVVSFTCCEQESKAHYKVKESISSHWDVASNSIKSGAFSLIPNISYYKTIGYISCCLWYITHDSIRHNLILQEGCFFFLIYFYGMSFSNNSSSFNGILITLFVITVQQQLPSCHSSSFISFSLQALTWFPTPIVSEHHTLFTFSFFNLARQLIPFSLTCIQKKRYHSELIPEVVG